MKLRSISTTDENKTRLIDKEVDVVQIDNKFYLFFPNDEISIEIDNPFNKEGILEEYHYEVANKDGDLKAWFKVKSYDTVYTIETLV